MAYQEKVFIPYDLPKADFGFCLCSGSKKQRCCSTEVGALVWKHLKLRSRQLRDLGVANERLEITCLGTCHDGPVFHIRDYKNNGEGKGYYLGVSEKDPIEEIDRILQERFPDEFLKIKNESFCGK